MKKIIISFLLGMIPKILTAQCAMCRAVLESEDGNVKAEGINDGIVYLMAIPYLLVFIIGYIVYRRIKH